MAEYAYLTDGIFTVATFLSAKECDALIEFAESKGFDEAPINTPLGPQMRKHIRNNERAIVDDLDHATKLWSQIQDYIPIHLDGWTACGVNERIRFYRYEIGQQFDWHFDGCFERDNGERSQLTFMIYLNEDFEGGETTLEDISIKPRKGLALFFKHRIRHKGQPVERGCKYVLRTDVMYRRDA